MESTADKSVYIIYIYIYIHDFLCRSASSDVWSLSVWGSQGQCCLEREGNAKMMFQVHSTLSARNWPGQNISRTSKEVQEKTQNPHGYQQKVKNVPGLSDGWQAAGLSKVERGHVPSGTRKNEMRKWMRIDIDWKMLATSRKHWETWGSGTYSSLW